MGKIEILCLFVKNYLSNSEFEQWLYQNIEDLKNELYDNYNLYYEIISTNYDNKVEVITLKNVMENYLSQKYNDKLSNIGSGFIDLVINSESEDPIINIIKKKYSRKDEVEFNCLNINTVEELHLDIKKKFRFSEYYGLNWNALRDFLIETELPRQIIFNGWNYLLKKMPEDCMILETILEEYGHDCKVIFK